MPDELQSDTPPSPDERRWWEMQLGISLRGIRLQPPAPAAEEPMPLDPSPPRTADEHHWWEMQLGKRLRRTRK